LEFLGGEREEEEEEDPREEKTHLPFSSLYSTTTTTQTTTVPARVPLDLPLGVAREVGGAAGGRQVFSFTPPPFFSEVDDDDRLSRKGAQQLVSHSFSFPPRLHNNNKKCFLSTGAYAGKY
jgi:hypothetical protein